MCIRDRNSHHYITQYLKFGLVFNLGLQYIDLPLNQIFHYLKGNDTRENLICLDFLIVESCSVLRLNADQGKEHPHFLFCVCPKGCSSGTEASQCFFCFSSTYSLLGSDSMRSSSEFLLSRRLSLHKLDVISS
eukprot:TRINITY_DN11645_c0_g2_i2.p1 TRINITY_DN11645_c0_g2~~TRINITY_DN11645_c0_g2_i2.p1  ORF type:complete len:153 (+),score=15.49 TRINITY_DN11645_c0_g2_i2:61-459(+)